MARGVRPLKDNPDEDNSLSSAQPTADMNMNSLRSGLTLTLNNLAVPIPPPSIEDVQEGGQILFRNFVREEFLSQGLREPPVSSFLPEAGDSSESRLANGAGTSTRLRGAAAMYPLDATPVVSTPEGYKTSDWIRIGRDMREIADSLAKSREGEAIQRKAAEVQLDQITEERFFNMMVELFSQGFTIERVVALFYFCTNLIIRAAQQNGTTRLTTCLFAWSLQYIRNKVCRWVYENGGWEKVLSKMYNAILKLCFVGILAITIGCGIVYIRKNW